MGAWGTGPLDNDTADDWLGDINIYLSNKIREACDEESKYYDPEKMRAACYLFGHVNFNPDDPAGLRELCVRSLKNLLKNTKWIEEWKTPEKVIESIIAQIWKINSVYTDT